MIGESRWDPLSLRLGTLGDGRAGRCSPTLDRHGTQFEGTHLLGSISCLVQVTGLTGQDDRGSAYDGK